MNDHLRDLSCQTHRKEKAKPGQTNTGLPYIQENSEKLAIIFRAHDVDVYHRPINTLWSLLVHHEVKTADLHKCGIGYQITRPQCQHLCMGEMGRTLANSGNHCQDHGHVISKNNVEAREEGWFKRNVVKPSNRFPSDMITKRYMKLTQMIFKPKLINST